MVLLDAHIENVDALVGVYPAYMGPHVRRVFRAVRTVRTIKSRQLAALELEVIIQIVLARERVAALVTRIIPALLRSIRIVDTLIGVVKSLHGGRSNLWEQKISQRNRNWKLGNFPAISRLPASEKKRIKRSKACSVRMHIFRDPFLLKSLLGYIE